MKTRPFSCGIEGCNQSFRDEVARKKHEDIHRRNLEGQITFKCLKCSRDFSTKQSLREHIYTHSGKKTFKCQEPGCGKAFRQSSQLCNHKKVHRDVREMMTKQRKEIEYSTESNELSSRVAVPGDNRDVFLRLPVIGNPQFGVVLPNFEVFNLKKLTF